MVLCTVIIEKTPGVLVKGMRGRGKGMNIETLQKPLPLVRGKGKGMACCTQRLPLLITKDIQGMFIYFLFL